MTGRVTAAGISQKRARLPPTESRNLSSRAAETLVLFMTSVLIAVMLVAPQPAAALGWELLALAVVSGTILFILGPAGR